MPGVHGVSPEWIYRFVVIVMVNLQLEEELLVTAVVLLERAARVSHLVLTDSNWQSVLLAAIVVAAKTHYDESVWLSDFVNRLRMYPLDSTFLHEIEMSFLSAIRFCVIVKPSSFYRYSSEIATLHDTHCPYRKSMSCDLSYRMLVRSSATSASWVPATGAGAGEGAGADGRGNEGAGAAMVTCLTCGNADGAPSTSSLSASGPGCEELRQGPSD
jgi:hypothetical protein